MKTLSGQHKKNIFTGLILVLIAFVCVIGIFYFLVNSQGKKAEEIDALKEQVASISAEREAIEKQAGALEKKVGTSLNLTKIVRKANEIYPEEEKNRREGQLWIDRKTASFVITLGALNGLIPGSQVVIYDGTERIGFATVEIPLDVISYVQPIDKPLIQFKNDYYRVVFEE